MQILDYQEFIPDRKLQCKHFNLPHNKSSFTIILYPPLTKGLSVFRSGTNYKVVSIPDRNPNRLPKIKKTKLKPIEKIQQISKELPTFLDDRNAKVEINDAPADNK